jgi:hypothetical protein
VNLQVLDLRVIYRVGWFVNAMIPLTQLQRLLLTVDLNTFAVTYLPPSLRGLRLRAISFIGSERAIHSLQQTIDCIGQLPELEELDMQLFGDKPLSYAPLQKLLHLRYLKMIHDTSTRFSGYLSTSGDVLQDIGCLAQVRRLYVPLSGLLLLLRLPAHKLHALEDIGVIQLDEPMSKLLPTLPSLTMLQAGTITGEVSFHFLRHLPKLSSLSLRLVCASLTSAHTLIDVVCAGHCRQLLSLELQHAPFEDDALRRLLKHLPQLQQLTLASTFLMHSLRWMSGIASLTRLRLERCLHMQSDVRAELAHLSSLQALRHIQLKQTFARMPTSDELSQYRTQVLPQLHSLVCLAEKKVDECKMGISNRL